MFCYHIRPVRKDDIHELEAIAKVEAMCFPLEEAAPAEVLQARAETFPESFLTAEEDRPEGGRIIGFINGCVTNEKTICDEMFEDASLHCPEGEYQSIFGLDVIPECRRNGVATALMEALISAARSAGRKGLILTCKNHLIPYYERFGYRNMGVSRSVHGGAVWYDMILEF